MGCPSKPTLQPWRLLAVVGMLCFPAKPLRAQGLHRRAAAAACLNGTGNQRRTGGIACEQSSPRASILPVLPEPAAFPSPVLAE